MANFMTIKGVLNSISGLILGKSGNIIKSKDASTISVRNNADGADINLEALRLVSTQTTGTSPLSVASITVNTNLNSDLLDDHHFSDIEYYHGVYARSTTSGLNCLPTNLTTTTFTLGATANPIIYWYQGTKVIVNSDKTATLDDGAGGSTAGLYYVYFNAALGTILATKNSPGFSNTSNIIIATVLWNGTDYGLVSDERHGYSRNCSWHQWAHSTVGCRYQTGLTMTNSGTGASATFTSTGGNLWDEDIDFSVPASSAFPIANTCRLLWQNGASSYTFDSTPSTVPFKRGANNRPVYINSTYNVVQMTSATNRYINFFVYGSLDLHTPIYIFAETVSVAVASNNGYNNVTAARAVGFPSLVGMGLSPEIKPIYRFIVRADGQVQAIDLILDDYRMVTSLPMAAGTVSTTASTVSAIPTGQLTGTSVQAQLDQLGVSVLPALTSGGIIYGDSSLVPTNLPKNIDGQVLTLASGFPTWSSAGTGDVTSSVSSSIDNQIARFDSTSGKIIQNSLATVNDSGDITAPRLISNVAQGTAPLGITSTTVNTNLNADLLDGYHSSDLVLSNNFTRNLSYAVGGGSADAYTVTLNPAPSSYTDGMRVSFKVPATNTTTSPKVNVNSLGNKNMMYNNGNDLKVGDLPINSIVDLVYTTSSNSFVVIGGLALDTLKLAGLSSATISTGNTIAQRDVSGNLTAMGFVSDATTGTAPLTITSTTKCTNLNSDQVDGCHVNDSGTGTSDLWSANKIQSAITAGGSSNALLIMSCGGIGGW